MVELAVAVYDLRYSLLAISMMIVFVLLRLDSLSAAPYNGVAFLLDSSFISCHLSLLASGELAGVRLGEGV